MIRSEGRSADDDAAQEELFSVFADHACPVLDPTTGLCDLYAFRPLSCRTFGPPARIGDEDLPPCRLCFAGHAELEIEACRVEFRVQDEVEMLREMGDPPETVDRTCAGGHRSPTMARVLGPSIIKS